MRKILLVVLVAVSFTSCISDEILSPLSCGEINTKYAKLVLKEAIENGYEPGYLNINMDNILEPGYLDPFFDPNYRIFSKVYQKYEDEWKKAMRDCNW